MLDEFQTEAVRHFEGPCLTIAGPGSGKTKCLVERTLRLMTVQGVPPEKILVITFTKAAALEMEARFQREAPVTGKRPYFGTFHALFLHILSIERGVSPDDVLSAGEAYAILASVLFGHRREREFVSYPEVLQEISYCKNRGISFSSFSSKILPREFAEVAMAYEEMKRRRRRLDFDDMMTEAYALLCQDTKVRQRWQRAFDFLLLDEMQDINPLQFSILKLLLDDRQNLFAVGDDDQSIYGFRGSDPRLMLEFQNEFPGAKHIVLRYNYRSTRQIVEAAGRLIGNNRFRFAKEVAAKSQSTGRVSYHCFATEEEQGSYILSRLCTGEGKSHSVAVLFRNKSDALPLYLLLEQKNTPYYVKEELFQKRLSHIARDLTAYLTLAAHPGDDAARGQLEGKPLGDFCILRHLSPYAAVNYVRKGMGYDAYLLQRYRDKESLRRLAQSVADAFLGEMRRYPSLAEAVGDKERLHQLGLPHRCRVAKEREAAVSLYTFHGAKGLEFDEVYVINVNEGVVPSAAKDADIEEERRMLYVALTRARFFLHVCCIGQRGGKPVHPSRFLNEMQGDAKE